MKVALAGKDEMIEVADDITPEALEAEARKYYTPEEWNSFAQPEPTVETPTEGNRETFSLSQPQELAVPPTFTDREKYRYQKGRAYVDTSKAYWDAMWADDDTPAKQFEATTMKNYTPENDKKYAADNWTEKFVGATTEIVPYMLDSAVQGVMYGELFGRSTGIATALSGQIEAVPAAYLTGRLVGQAYGTWQNAAKVEGGSVYQTLLKDGVDRAIAKEWAIPAGYVIGAIELLQVGQVFNRFMPTFGKAAALEVIRKAAKNQSSNLAKTIAKNTARLTTQVALRTAIEVPEEVTQEVVSITAEIGAHIFQAAADNAGYQGPTLDENITRLQDTIVQSLLAFPLLGLPGSVHTTLVSYNRERVIEYVRTERANEALRNELQGEIENAMQYKSYAEYVDARGVVDPELAQSTGFDNGATLTLAVWNAAQDIKGENEGVSELVKEEEKKKLPPTVILEAQAKGRVNQLVDESNAVLRQIDSLERQKKRLQDAGKSVDALDAELSRLAKQYNYMDDQIAEIMTSDEVNLTEEKIQMKARELVAIGKKVAKTAAAEATAEQKAIAKEKAEKIEEIKSLLVDYARDNLSREDRGAFLTAVANVKTEKQLEKQLQRVEEHAEKANKKGLVRQIKKQIDNIASSRVIATEYVQKIQEFIRDYELKGHGKDTLRALKATRDFIDSERAAGRGVMMPSYVNDALEILTRHPLAELTSADLANILEKIKAMADIGRTKLRTRRALDKLLKARDLIALKEKSKPIQSREIKTGNVIEGKLSPIDGFINGVKKGLNLAQLKDLVITPMNTVFDYLDGGAKYVGPNFRIFKRRVDVAFNEYLQMKDDINHRVDTKANELGLDIDSMERIGIYAAKVQEGGNDRLLSMFTQDQIDSVKLTDNEMAFYRAMRTELETIHPLMEQVMREVYNKPLSKVKNYFPYMMDFEALSDAEIADRFGDPNVPQRDVLKKNVDISATKQRVGGKAPIKVNAAAIFGSYIDNAAYLITVGKETKYLGELAKTPEYMEAVGDIGQHVVRQWVDIVARKGLDRGDPVPLLDALRNYTGLVALGLKLSSTLIQVTSLMDGAALIGGKAFSGFSRVIVDGKWRKFVMDNMPEIRDRVGDDPAFANFATDSFFKKLGNLAYASLKTVDKLTATGVAAGAYIKFMDDRGIPVDLANPNPDAIAYAQMIAERTQSSSQFKDLPLAFSQGLLTGNRSLDKTLLQFQSFMLTRWALIRHDFWRAGIMKKDASEATGIALWLVAANMAEYGIRMITKETIGALVGVEPPPDDDEDLALYQKVGQALQTVPFVGNMWYAGLYDSFPVPSVSMLLRLTRKWKSALSADEYTKASKVLKAVANMIPGGQQIENLFDEE